MYLNISMAAQTEFWTAVSTFSSESETSKDPTIFTAEPARNSGKTYLYQKSKIKNFTEYHITQSSHPAAHSPTQQSFELQIRGHPW